MDATRPATALEADFQVEVGRGPTRFSVEARFALDQGVLVLFGPSGAGKTLTLQAIAGILRPKRGWIRASGRTLFDREGGVNVPAHDRRIGYVPQHHSLFPFCDVAENVAFGLSRKERRRDHPVVRGLLVELGLEALERARPERLSGGERQRVALARALAVKPDLLVLDEPFASIDREGRVGLRAILKGVLVRHRTPAVFVTHDLEEARELGSMLVRFEKGRSGPSGSPDQILGAAKSVVISGRVAAEVRPTGSGRAEIGLAEARVEGPADLLVARDGRLNLRLEGPKEGYPKDEKNAS